MIPNPPRNIIVVGCDLGSRDSVSVRAIMQRALSGEVSIVEMVELTRPKDIPEFTVKASDLVNDKVFTFDEKRRTKHKGRKNLGAFGKSRR